MSARQTITLASLARARTRQRMTTDLLRPLALGVVLLVAVGSSRASPRPGLHADHLGVLVSLVATGVGVVGIAVTGRDTRLPVQLALYLLLALGSAGLVRYQPHGPGYVIGLAAVASATLRAGSAAGAIVAIVAVGGFTLAGFLQSSRSIASIVAISIGVVAFFVIAQLARRLREGQEEAERLLLEIAGSREAQAEAAVLAERQRLAREMHDVLAHSLSGLVLQLEGARLLVARGPASGELASAVDRAHHLARAGLDEARRAIGMLRGDELPGPERLAGLAQEFERDTGVPCDVVLSGEQRALAPEARLTVYRVAQEALTNVRRHAAPQRVALTLTYEPDGARLVVEDFAAAPIAADGAPAGAGFGLRGMRERADLLGARLSAGSTSSGFRVELWMPA